MAQAIRKEKPIHDFFEMHTVSHRSVQPTDHAPILGTLSTSRTTSWALRHDAKDSPRQDGGRIALTAREYNAESLNPASRVKTTSSQISLIGDRAVTERCMENTNNDEMESKLRPRLDSAATIDDVGNIESPKTPLRSPDITIDIATEGFSLDGPADTNPSNRKKPSSSNAMPPKTLRLNRKTGAMGSPPAKKSTRTDTLTTGTSLLRKESNFVKSRIVLRYGHDSISRPIIGDDINRLLQGTSRFSSIRKSILNVSKTIPQSCPPKSTHPFFLRKINSKAPSTPEVSVTKKLPSLRASLTLGEAISRSPANKQGPQDGPSGPHGFGNMSRLTKVPGAVEPCWPPQGMVHVRGQAPRVPPDLHQPSQSFPKSDGKKSKYTTTETTVNDDILHVTAGRLRINDALEDLAQISTDNFAEPEKCLRLPEKHFETGFEIQRRVRPEISVRLPQGVTSGLCASSEDELQSEKWTQGSINPALLRIYDIIPTSLSAFDRSGYETQSWIHKYAPCAASDVLQRGREAFILKEWLQALTVTSVDTGTGDKTLSRGCSVASRRSALSKSEKPGNKKRKTNQLDGFVVSSDEERDEMDELDDIVDTEDEMTIRGSQSLLKKTVVRSMDTAARRGQEPKKIANAVVISGPSGCGKTAMVYAVAKELGFEVFEINAGSRRSGKDVLERVGDMTRNHLVHRGKEALIPGNEDLHNISCALDADLNARRQGTMKSFFVPKTTTYLQQSDAVSAKGRQKEKPGRHSAEPSKVSPKQQKQSLILLEEVDILFEEDKQFWTTVTTLIAQSKRPVIMTCNDENLLPLQTLCLQAIIRLTPPPLDTASDYMLLVAAAEGHIVKRRAVKTLYKARNFDLRATLTELEYWCQIGVGDCKGGLEWFYPRWPPGSDQDNHGNTIRVVSEGTYKTGMGWLGRDFTFNRSHEQQVKEEALRQTWNSWHLDAGDWHDTMDIASLVWGMQRPSRLAALESYEAFTESMSMADICASGGLATDYQTVLDTTSPELSQKSRNDFTVGHELIQADASTRFINVNNDIAFWFKSQACESLRSGGHTQLKASSEKQISAKLSQLCRTEEPITRRDFKNAFDPIAEPQRIGTQAASYLDASVFDRTISTIAVDVAPFVRSIMSSDDKLREERARLSNLLSEGGRQGKRPRTTRSAISALEGGARRTTRPDRYFGDIVNPHLVNRTGLPYWQEAIACEEKRTREHAEEATAEDTEKSSGDMTESS